MQIINFQHPQLCIDTLHIKPGEIWSLFGTNDSGIDCFVDLCEGKISDYSAELLLLSDHLSVLSFKRQQEIFEEELRNDDSDFLGRFDPGTLVRDFIPDAEHHLPLLNAFGMEECLDLGYRQLSSGQCRKLHLLKEVISGARSLLLQNPYDGLDKQSCQELNQLLQVLSQKQLSTILVLNNIDDIPNCCSHLGVLEQGYLRNAGEIEKVKGMMTDSKPGQKQSTSCAQTNTLSWLPAEEAEKEELICLSDGFASYGENILFTDLNLTVYSGDHTLITGPNGCGKSTLLSILSGDNSNCYANNLRIFGNQRGSGESIWELKQQMGLISPGLHRDHRVPGTALHIVLSGLFDSIGLYKKVRKTDIHAAVKLLDWLGLADKKDVSFRQLSFSEQRLILIGRALIKQPKLLILDEPTHGLDDYNRTKLLSLLEDIANRQLSTIIYVSHREDEFRAFYTCQIQLDSYAP